MITYIYGIIFVQFTTTHLLEGDSDPAAIELLHEYWGTVFKAMLSLYWASTSGESWRYLAEPLRGVGGHAHFLFLVYIAFFMFVITNTLTSLFVEAALDNSEHDHAKQIREEMNKKQKYIDDLKKLYHLVDDDGDGELTLDEFQAGCGDAELEAFANSLDIETSDLSQVFFLLSNQGRQAVDMDAFVTGCIKLRGPARSSDLNLLLHEHYRLQQTAAHFFGTYSAKLEHLEEILPQKAPPQTSTPPELEARLARIEQLLLHRKVSVPQDKPQQNAVPFPGISLPVLTGHIGAANDVGEHDERKFLEI
eukprot:gnl/TRDRNA2_/TRDRNA2_169097_c0_seq2.p1 gnl/TRDRNA2_/TRDRNA2_169097_c0~~gnl/TRDRNA2_/TRDRNA2_169097_c0_seq2.p1  ORF type:complete len:307 (+),score=56.84 gnl/TRDRNA2_/TRDRNA2_169097_c0_seq2:3-923(+)